MSGNSDFTITAAMPGASWDRLWLDACAKPLMTNQYGVPQRGSILFDSEIAEVQQDGFHRPIRHVKVNVALDGLKPYSVLVPLSELNGTRADFVTTMESKVLPAGTKCSESLRDAILAASYAPETWKTHDREFVSTDGKLVANGRVIANFVFCICGEKTNAYGEKTYILRKDDGQRIEVPASEMPLGNYAWRFGGNSTVYDYMEAFLQLKRQYDGLTDFEKREFELEPYRKEQERIREEMRRQSRIKFPGLSNDHLDPALGGQ